MKESHLPGGRVTPGVVRVGNTVRRPSTPNSAFVRRLLTHLENVGFNGAPRSLGIDEQGRDILGYVEGWVPTELGWFDDDVLVAAARLIRRFHDATASFVGTGAAQSARIDVVCHNDLSPCNFVFRDGVPISMIDFDTAAPGDRAYDLGYAAWLWLDIGCPDIRAREQKRRLRLFIDGYGGEPDQRSIVQAIKTRQRVLMAEGRRTSKESMSRWAEACLRWTSERL